MIVDWQDHKNVQETFSRILLKSCTALRQSNMLFDENGTFDSSKIDVNFSINGIEIDLVQICETLDEEKQIYNEQIYNEGIQAGKSLTRETIIKNFIDILIREEE